MVRTVDLPDLGAVTDDCTLVTDHAGTGSVRATSITTYIAAGLRALFFGSGPASATWYGATGNGSTDDRAAIAAAFAAHDDVRLPPGTYRLGADLTIARGQRIIFAPGASLLVDSGKTVTIHGAIDALPQQIFAGSGTVTGIRQVYPEWWGAIIDDALTDSQPALAAAHACVHDSLASDGGRPTIRLGGGTYYLGDTWTVAPTANCQLVVEGEGNIFGGSRLQPIAGFPAAPVMLVDGDADAIQAITDFRLASFSIIGDGGDATVGLQIGRSTDTTHQINAVHQSLVEDIYIENFPTGILISHAQLIAFNRCSVWNNSFVGANSCVYLYETGGTFTGDMDFVDCELVGNAAADSQGFVLSSVTAGGAVAGVRFRGCFTSACDRSFYLNATAGGTVHDVWVTGGCQIDFAVVQPVYVYAQGTASYVRNVQIADAFIDGGADQITLFADTDGQVLDVRVEGNWLAQATGRALTSSGARGIVCNSNTIADNNNIAGPALEFNAVVAFTCSDNINTQAGTTNVCKYLVTIEGASDYYTVLGNVGAGLVVTTTINDAADGAHKAVANNI